MRLCTSFHAFGVLLGDYLLSDFFFNVVTLLEIIEVRSLSHFA